MPYNPLGILKLGVQTTIQHTTLMSLRRLSSLSAHIKT